jgi:hypothetical protein
MRRGRPLSPFRARELARALAPRHRPGADDDIERLIGLPRLLAPFTPLAGFHQRAAALIRGAGLVVARVDQDFGRELAEFVFADPVRQMQRSWTPRAGLVRPGDEIP